jgi:hypothetical protein
MQIKTILIFHLTSVKMVTRKKANNQTTTNAGEDGVEGERGRKGPLYTIGGNVNQ